MNAPVPIPRIDELVNAWRLFARSALLRDDKVRAQNADDTVAALLELKRLRDPPRTRL
jgi:hypothetical protein